MKMLQSFLLNFQFSDRINDNFYIGIEFLGGSLNSQAAHSQMYEQVANIISLFLLRII